MAVVPNGSTAIDAPMASPVIGPAVSVVVTTGRNSSTLERCLRSILACDYDHFEVIVVENRPNSLDTPRMLLRQFPGELRLRYAEEPSPSISLARNTGLARAEGEVVAFADDEVVVDRLWLRASVDALLADRGVGCVTGVSLPREPDEVAQWLLARTVPSDEAGTRRTFRLTDSRKANRLLYSAGALRSRAGIVMLTHVGRELGGFDPALGPATSARGSEDFDLLVRLLGKGYALSHEPRAVMWRDRPADARPQRRQAYRGGLGLGATIGKHLIAGPRRRDWLRAIPTELRYAGDPHRGENVDPRENFDQLGNDHAPGDVGGVKRPRHLRWLTRLGMLIGPIAYLVSAMIVGARRLIGRRPSSPRPARIVRRMVVGDDTINVVWFGESPAPKVRFVWRHPNGSETTSPFEGLVPASAMALAPPAMSATGTLRITAVVPTRNAEAWIESCLRAIRDNDPAEVILVDGGSTDRTVELARPWVDQVIDDGGAGVAAARMLGAVEASQPWIALVDADVVLPRNALRELDRERYERQLVAVQAGLHSVGEGDYWSTSLADHHNHGQSKSWFGVCASLISRDVLLAHPLDVQLRSGEDIDLRIRLSRAGLPIGVSEDMIGQHRFANGFAFAGKQWLADGAGLGRMVRKHGHAALVNMMIPFGAAAFGLARGMRDALRSWPYFAGFALGNYIGLWRGLMDRRVPARGGRRKLLVACTLIWLLALPVLLAGASAATALLLIRLAHAAYQGRLLLVTLGILAVAIPFEVGRGSDSGRFSTIARHIAPFTAWAVLLGLILSGLRLARVVGL